MKRGVGDMENNSPKCEDCEYMECAGGIYKSYYCVKNDRYIHLGVDVPPKKPPKICPKLSASMEG